jgi:Na+-driven multidrug efflux pump
VVGTVLTIVLLATRGPLTHVFTDDPAVRALAAFVLLHLAVLQPLNGVLFALDGILIGAGDQRYLALTMPIATGVLGVAVAIAWSQAAGLGWLWFALELFFATRLAALVLRFRTDHWRVVGAAR